MKCDDERTSVRRECCRLWANTEEAGQANNLFENGMV